MSNTSFVLNQTIIAQSKVGKSKNNNSKKKKMRTNHTSINVERWNLKTKFKPEVVIEKQDISYMKDHNFQANYIVQLRLIIFVLLWKLNILNEK